MKLSRERINELIETYGMSLPEEDPEGGGIICPYCPEIEEDPELQQLILSNIQEIFEELQRRLREDTARRERTARLRRIK